MTSRDYFIDIEAKLIRLPNSRWYETSSGTFPSVTTILSTKASSGLTSWQTKLAMNGIDPKEVGREAMDEGSKVHDACERLLKGEKLSFYNLDTGEENYKLFEEWKPICRFKEAVLAHDIKPLLIEQTIFSKKKEYAGTLDLVCTLRPDPKKAERVLAIIDLKRSANAYTTYHWQVASYYYALEEMINDNSPEMEGFRKIASDYLKGHNIKDAQLFILLLNTDTKKGWRLTEIENKEEKFNLFLACNTIWRGENPNLNYVMEQYPLEITLKEEVVNNELAI